MSLSMTRDVQRGEPHNLRLPCLGCKVPLPEPPWSMTKCVPGRDEPWVIHDVVECDCGIRYSGELLRTAHPEMWAYIMHKGLACTECDPNVPVIYTDDGHPIACPKHGAR